MLELMVRLVASLAVVVGLMLLLAKLVGKRYGARAGAPVQVLHRQPLSRSASVAVVTVGSRVLVLGATDQQVSLLTELDPEELVVAELEAGLDAELDADLDLAADRSGDLAAPAPGRTTAAPGALAGSVLSPQTWRQAIAAATGKTS